MSHEHVFAELQNEIEQLDIAARTTDAGVLPGRRRSSSTPHDAVAMRIVEHDGVLYLEEGLPPRSMAGPRRRRGPRAGGERGEDRELLLSRLEPSKVGEALRALDTRINAFLAPDDRASGGLRELRIADTGDEVSATLEEPGPRAVDGDILLLVHGTFSESETFPKSIDQAPNRDAFYRWLDKTYDQVLAFDHPTLAVSPALNARRLHEELGDLGNASVDVVCHSRGGLVTRWWLEAFDSGSADRRRAVFVASPLHGTGLAAPENVRGSLSMLLNLADAVVAAPLALAGAVLPFGAVVSQLFRIFTSVTSIAVKSPAVDAAIALVPGLAAMSRTSNNFELQELRRQVELRKRYFAVQSNFESEKAGWQFWKKFRRDQLLNAAADSVFDGHNDLVVDTDSMTDFAPAGKAVPKKQLLDFGTKDDVHHTNYFAQEKTLSQLMDWLG